MGGAVILRYGKITQRLQYKPPHYIITQEIEIKKFSKTIDKLLYPWYN